ncbi:hypothetical protein Tco_1137716, partial [Tanacetum coccineum]
KLLKKATTKIARPDQRIQAREEEIKKLDQEIKSLRAVEVEVHVLHSQTKNLEALLEAEVDMKKAAEAKNAELTKELQSLRVQFSDLQVSNNQLSQQVSNLQAQVTSEKNIKAAFKEFKKYEDDKRSRVVTRHGLRLAVMKCSESLELRQAFADVMSTGLIKGMSEGLKHGIDHGKVGRDLAAVEAYDPETDSKRCPQWIRDIRPSSSQLKIPVYPKVRDPRDPWAFKEEMLLEDAIAANISWAEKRRSAGWFVTPMGLVWLITPDLTTSPYSYLLSLPRGWRFCRRMPPHRPR